MQTFESKPRGEFHSRLFAKAINSGLKIVGGWGLAMSGCVVEEEILRLEKAWVYNGSVLTLKIEIKIDGDKTAFPSFNELRVGLRIVTMVTVSLSKNQHRLHGTYSLSCGGSLFSDPRSFT